MRKIAYAVLAVALILTGMGSVQAAPTLVETDSGNIGEFTFTNTGVSAGVATILVAVPSITSQINTVNGALVSPEAVHVNTPLTFLATPTGGGFYSLALSPSDAVKTVGGTIGQQAIMPFSLSSGNTPTSLPDFFNASGLVTSVIANNNPLYDFSAFSNGKGSINLTFTATSFTGASDFSGFFSTNGATAVGNGSFSQAAAVPEPHFMVMAGFTLLGAFIWYRPRFRASRAG